MAAYDKMNKIFRVLNIYDRLRRGEILIKSELAESFGVNEKTIQRYINDLRIYFEECYVFERGFVVKYDKKKNGYYLDRENSLNIIQTEGEEKQR